ncbi:MAG TPA: sugar ABC transporter permease [Candidatus Mediterraneibacter pullistercoris]|nr:sugar ABC transporter permease [Candidatus Mediterraneibacter pullistercoris]
MRTKRKINWFMILLLIPAVAMLTVTIIMPVFVVVGMSFFRYNLLDMANVHWNNFANYKAVFADPEFVKTFGRTLTYVCGTVGAQFVIGLGVALLLNSKRIRGRRIFRSLLFLPWTIPSLVVAVTWMFILQPQYGVMNYLLGLGDYSILGNSSTAMLGIIVSAVWKQMPLMMIMLLSGLQTVPEDLKEAAEIDGANGFQKFLCITIPCIMPVIKTVTLTSIVSNFQMFVLFFTMTGGGPVRATTTLPLYTYETAFTGFDLGKGAAMGVCWLVFLVVFSVIYNKVLSAKEIEY